MILQPADWLVEGGWRGEEGRRGRGVNVQTLPEDMAGDTLGTRTTQHSNR